MVRLNLGNWLKPDFVREHKTGIFKDEGKAVEAFGKPAVQLTITFPNGEEKEWTPNYTSMKTLSYAYGPDTKNWVGKTVNFEILVNNIKGEKKACILGSAMKEEIVN